MIEVRQTKEFSFWLSSLRDIRAQARIVARPRKMELGNLGDWKPVGGPVCEARVDYGPGYRLYFIRDGEAVVILLCGGDKASQRRDIARARALASED